MFAIVGSIFVFLNFLTFIFFAFLAGAVGSISGGLTGSLYGGTQPSSGIAIVGITTLLIGAVIALAIVVTQVVYTYARSRTLCDELAPGARPRSFRAQSGEVEARLAQIDQAQHGNLVLYAGDRPFIGTGFRLRSWSIAIELERMNADGPAPPNASCAREYAPIDPVELHQVIRERLLGLRDGQLPPNEQIRALTVHDHIVGPGWQPRQSPLIDQVLTMPYSQASDAAVDALIRHPQAGMRYYQRVSIRDEGQAVWSGPDKVIDGTDLEIASSAFIYAAVEGRMFYLEFVSTVLPPVHGRLHDIDLLPRLSAGRFFTYVVMDSLSSIFRDLIYAPARAVGSIRQAAREGRSYRRHADVVKDFAYDNVGALISVRERGSANHLGDYIQELDAEKYTKLVERLVTDTVMDFLDSRGVNISEFVNSASTVINNNGHHLELELRQQLPAERKLQRRQPRDGAPGRRPVPIRRALGPGRT